MSFTRYCNKSENLNGYMGNRMIVNVLVVYPCDCMADWELWLAAAAQLHKSIVLHIASPRKIKIQNSKYSFYRMLSLSQH